MLQPRKPLDLSGAKSILSEERKPLDLSGAEAILKKKDSTGPILEEESETVIGSSDGVEPKMKTFTGLTKEDLKTIKSPETPLPKINKKLKTALDVNKANLQRKETLEKELKDAKVTPENQEEISKKTDELSAITKQQQEFKEASQARALEKQKYSKIGSLTNKLETGSSQLGVDFAAIPELVYDVFSVPQNAIADVFDLPSLRTDAEKFKQTVGVNNAVKDYYKQQVTELRQKAQETDLKYKDGIYDSFVNGDYAGGFDQLTNSFAESLPASASTMIGGAYMKAPQLIAASSMMFGAGKSEQLKDENPEMNNNARVANALATGLIQGATESLGTGSIGAAAKGLVEREGEKKAVAILKDGLTEYYKAALKKNPLLASMTGEGLEEAFQGVAENAVDVATGVKPENYNVYKNMADDFIGGAFGGAVFGGGLKVLQQTTNYQDKKQIKNNTKQVFNLQNELKNPELSIETKKEIEKTIDGLIKTNRKLVRKNVDNVESLSAMAKEELLKSIQITESTQEKAKQIKLDPNTSNETKQILLNNLEKEYKEANKVKNGILEGSTSEVDLLPLKEQDKLKREALKELTQELNPDGKKNITISNEQILERANKNYSNQIKNEIKSETTVAGPTEIESQTEVQEPTDETQEIEKVIPEPVVENREIEYTNGKGEKAVLNTKDIEVTEKGNKFLFTEKGNRIGHIEIKKPEGNEVSVSLSGIFNPSLERKGIGTIMYKKVAEILKSKYNLDLVSDKQRSKDSEALWAKLEREGNAVVIGDKSKGNINDYQYKYIHEATPESNIATDEGVRTGTEPVDEVRTTEQESVVKEPVSETVEPRTSETKIEIEKPSTKNEPAIEELRDKIKELPHSGKFAKYASGETISREHDEPRNAQDIEVSMLKDVGQHGIETIKKAKEIFGNDYVEKTLEYLDEANLKPHEKAVLYVSLENEMYNRLKDNPNNVSDKKLQDLVRAKSQEHLREASLGINAGRLRAFMKEGYIPETITNKMFSEQQLKGKRDIEKSIQANADEINKEAESKSSVLNDEQLEKIISEGVSKAIEDIYQNLPTQRKQKADKAIGALENIQKKLKGKAYDATIGIPIAIIDSGISVIKNAIKAGVAIADAIELGIKHIKNKHGEKWDKESEFREDMINGFNDLGISMREKSQSNKYKNEIKNLLIDSGFGREITVTVNERDNNGTIVVDDSGKPKKVKEKRIVLDWKKLAGPQGSIDKIRENVENALKKKGYSEEEIKKISKEYEKEYNELRASIIEKSINELNRRNEPRKKIDTKSTAKRLAELYNYGLFEKEKDTYNNLINSALGLNDLDQKSFKYLESLAKSLSDLYDTGHSEMALSPAIANINKKIARTLSNVAFNQSNKAFKVANIASEYINLSQRFLLVTLGQLIDNPVSGKVQRIMSKLAYAFDKTDNKALEEQRKKISKERFKSIVRDAGDAYGDSSSLLINESKVENWLNNRTDSQIQHSIISFYMGRAFLEGFDSRHKTVLTEKYFVHNLIKVLSDKSNPNAMTKEKALEFVTEKLTGESFEDAKNKAREITNKINEDAGSKILSDSERAINIFAQEIMKDSLLNGEKLSKEEIEASYNAAYKSAGKDIGHVANNPLSESVGALSANTSKRLEKAIKDKNWNTAALYTMEQILTRNIMNTFVGGGTNWAVLGAQKSGLFGLPFVAIDAIKKSGKNIDLTTEEGIKNLENVLEKSQTYKNTASRVFINSMAALIVCATAVASGADDDLNSWLKKNKWAKKWFDKLAPSYLVGLLSYENEEMGKYYEKLLNVKPELFNENRNLAKSMSELHDKDNENKGGSLGKVIGSKLNAPAPFRMAQDIRDIYRGVSGKAPIEKKFKASNFWNGYFQGGLVDFLGLRPGPDVEEKGRVKKYNPEKEESEDKEETEKDSEK